MNDPLCFTGIQESPDPYRQRANRLRPDREPARSMSPGEFVAILERNLHPRWWSVGVFTSRFGERRRESLGIGNRHGTVWVGPAAGGDRVWVCSVLADEIPYWPPLLNNVFDDASTRFKDGGPVPGWRAVLSDLVKRGVLKPSARLDWLTGEDGRLVCAEGLAEGKWIWEKEPIR